MRRNNILRTSVALAAVTALLGACSESSADPDDRVDESPSPSSTPTEASSSPTAGARLPDGVLPLPERDAGQEYATLEPGRYHVPLDETLAIEVDVPETSYAHDDGLFIATGPVILKTEVAGEEYGVPADPCTAAFVKPVGPTVDDLVEAILDEPTYQVSDPEPVEVGGAEGTYLEIRVPAAFDASSCHGQVLLPGKAATKTAWEPGYRGQWWILDVEGQRVVVAQNCTCGAAVLDRAAATARSITFTPTS